MLAQVIDRQQHLNCVSLKLLGTTDDPDAAAKARA